MVRWIVTTSILVWFSTLTFVCQAQKIKKFSDNTTSFIEELKVFMSPNISKDNEKELFTFIESWNMGFLSEEEKQLCIQVCNAMLKTKAAANPHFFSYIRLITDLKSKRSYNDFFIWQKGLLTLLDKGMSLRNMQMLFSNTAALLSSSVIYKSASTEWKVSGGDYEIKFDSTIRIYFPKTDLMCYAKRDSMKIYATKGQADIITNSWQGIGGRVTWERSKYKPDEVYANLKNYSINFTCSEYFADSVVFVNKPFLSYPLIGKLNDKVVQVTSVENLDYPEFVSYVNEFKIKNFYKNVDYEGGFLFSGSKIIGRGTKENQAKLIFTRSDTILVLARSNYFVVRKEQIRGMNTSVSIFLGKDSIYHPDLSFKYFANKRELNLQRTTDITSLAPYNNSYHVMNMNFDQLYWMIDGPSIYLTMQKGSAEGKANFQSENYFDPDVYEAMRGMDFEHPLVAVKMMSDKLKRDEFTADEFARFMKIDISQIRHYLMNIAAQGFIYFNTETDYVVVRPRLYDYILASMGKIDYDVINFKSYTKAPVENAFLDVRTMDLFVNGLPNVMVSKVQNVRLFPQSNQIIIKRNRNFQLDGKVVAGLFTFTGDNFFFQYDSFKINLQNIDSVKIRVQVGIDNFGDPIYRGIKSVIENVTGDLLVDKEDNKSGIKDYPEYPIFNSRQYSYVYYNDKKTLGGKYPKTTFFFKIDPFVIDSLDNFAREVLNFEGTLVSAGIFPDIRQKLRLRDDMSMGFVDTTTTDGYPVYGGKGRFYQELDLSNRGLHGKGKLEYLTSTGYSDDFIFFPDSVNSHLNEFFIEKQTSGVEYPMVKNQKVYMHWMPYENDMALTNTAGPFTIINSQNTLDGILHYTANGLSGSGTMDMTTAQMKSNHYTYYSNAFTSDTAEFKLRSLQSDKFTVMTKNVNARIDYSEQKGTFKANDDYTLVEFPENRYISYLDVFTWDMDKKEFQMGAEKEYASQKKASFIRDSLSGPRYISVHPLQDSLSFVSNTAVYDYRNNLLKAFDVEYIKVADSRIFPKDGNVTVEANAFMKPLANSKILSNDTTRYYTFYNTVTSIMGAFKYSAKGDYDYVDESGKKQVIHFHSIKTDETNRTIGEASKIEPDSFMISPAFYFQGTIRVKTWEPDMYYKGATAMVTSCPSMGNKWLRFDSKIYYDSVYIPYSEKPQDINLAPVYSGIMISYDSIHVYPAFLSSSKSHSDEFISTASGYLSYNKYLNRYEIGSAEKIKDPDMPGNLVRLENNSCKVYSEGKIHFGVDLWQVKLNAYGRVNHWIDSNVTEINCLLYLDFHFTDILLKMMAQDLDSLADVKGRVDITPSYEKYMREIIYQENIKNITATALLYDSVDKWPVALKHNIMLNNLTLRWNQKTRSFRSVGKIGIASIGGTPINLNVDGYLEIAVRRYGDMFDLLLKVDPNNWYYFGYEHGVMQTLSTNLAYTNELAQMKGSKRKLKVKRGQKPYIFMLGTNEKMYRFLRRFEGKDAHKYLNKEGDMEETEIFEEEQ